MDLQAKWCFSFYNSIAAEGQVKSMWIFTKGFTKQFYEKNNALKSPTSNHKNTAMLKTTDPLCGNVSNKCVTIWLHHMGVQRHHCFTEVAECVQLQWCAHSDAFVYFSVIWSWLLNLGRFASKLILQNTESKIQNKHTFRFTHPHFPTFFQVKKEKTLTTNKLSLLKFLTIEFNRNPIFYF